MSKACGKHSRDFGVRVDGRNDIAGHSGRQWPRSLFRVCTVDGTEVSDSVTLDLGNFTDRFALSIPNRDEWIDLYPCTKVPGLE